MKFKVRIGLSMGAIVLSAGLIGGGTFAFFSDSVTKEGSMFTSGSVDINNVTEQKAFASVQYIRPLAPGDKETTTIEVKNDGDLGVWVTINQGASEKTKKGKLFKGPTPVTIQYEEGMKKLAPGETATFEVAYEFPLNAGNEYAEKTGKFDVVIDAVQTSNNDGTDGGSVIWKNEESDNQLNTGSDPETDSTKGSEVDTTKEAGMDSIGGSDTDTTTGPVTDSNAETGKE